MLHKLFTYESIFYWGGLDKLVCRNCMVSVANLLYFTELINLPCFLTSNSFYIQSNVYLAYCNFLGQISF